MRKIKAIVKSILAGSPAEKAGLKAGDLIEGVDGYAMLDILDWRYLTSDYTFVLQVLRNGEELELEVVRQEMSELGVEFEDILFDGIRECANKCIFCFVDQLPGGVRDTLCLKDDDYRLSFLQGNFVTLTNCSQRTLDRIVEFRMSPLYVSVHATDPEVRNRLLGRKTTKPIMDVLSYLGENGIEVHTQIVVVPGVNDSEVLRRSLNDLAGLFPVVKSIGVVPVGLTKHRSDADGIRPVSPDEARITLEIIDEAQRLFRSLHKTRLVWAADEYYIRAGRPFPASAEYEGYVQLENGIGLARSLYDDIEASLEGREMALAADISRDLIITGADGAIVVQPIFDSFRKQYGFGPKLLPVENAYFGSSVTVTGLIVGRDIIDAVKSAGRHAGNTRKVIIPDIMLRRGDAVLLDGMTPEEVGAAIGIETEVVGTGAEGLLKAAGLTPKGGTK